MSAAWGSHMSATIDHDAAPSVHHYDEFIEGFAALMESRGVPRAAGRIFSYLQVAEPAEQTAAQENKRLQGLLGYVDGPRFPENYSGVATRVVGRPPSAYDQEMLIAAGSGSGIQQNDPVVTEEGLVGLVTDVTSNGAKVTLLTDQSSAVSAMVLESGAAGIVRHGPGDPSALILDRVGKDALVQEGDLVITAGWRSGSLESLYPRGIPIGTVKSVGQQDVDLYKRIQIAPLVNFDALSDVVVIVPNTRPK